MEASDGLHSSAPWLPKQRKQCDLAQKALGAFAGILLVVYLIVMRLVILCVMLLKTVLELLAQLAGQHFGMVVEYVYRLRMCRLHVSFARFVQNTYLKRPYHSRYLDLRTEITLTGGGACFIHAIPCMTDNFCYALIDASEKDSLGLGVCLIDASDATAVVDALEHISERFYSEEGGLRLEAVFSTHRHWDHAGGNEDLVRLAEKHACVASNYSDGREEGYFVLTPQLQTEVTASDEAKTDEERANENDDPASHFFLQFVHPLQIFGYEGEDVPGCTRTLRHGEIVRVGGLRVQALSAPGHTEGSCMFRLIDSDGESIPTPDALFTGDTLFCGGCGAQFEGCSLDLEHCFATILENCGQSVETLLFPGHEYTNQLLSNNLDEAIASWAVAEPPGHFLALCGAVYVAKHRRNLRDKIPTVPCTLAYEKILNPNFDALFKHVSVLMNALEARTNPGGGGETECLSRFDVDAYLSTDPLPLCGASAICSQAEQECCVLMSSEANSCSPEEEALISQRDVAVSVEDGDKCTVYDPVTAKGIEVHFSDQVMEPAEGEISTVAERCPSRSEAQAESRDCDASVAKDPMDAPGEVKNPATGSAEKDFSMHPQGPCSQFAFLYHNDFREVVAALQEGRLDGKEAAAKLLECERSTFKTPVLTGKEDSFGDSGFVQEQSGDQSSAQGEEAKPCPSDEEIISALKVLGVMPQIPVGPKSPCKELLLPVNINRIGTLLRCMNVKDATVQRLTEIMRQDVNPLSHQDVTVLDVLGSLGLCDELFSQGIERIPSIPQSSDSDIRLLRDVLRTLNPQERKMSGCLRFLDWCWHLPAWCTNLCEALCSLLTTRSESSQVEDSPIGAVDGDQVSLDCEKRRRRDTIEATFRAHSLDQCSLCSPCFRVRLCKAPSCGATIFD